MNYGNCPMCGAEGTQRERKPNGNDTCGNKHIYPSADAIHATPRRALFARIVCAANRNGNGTVVCSVRHMDPLMHKTIDLLRSDSSFSEQGFINTKGTFLNRQEAWKAASKNNQIKYRVGGDTSNGGTLYSENLY